MNKNFLYTKYLALICSYWFWPATFTRGDVAIYIQTRHPDFTREQARRYARIVHGWIVSGYVPARFIHHHTKG